MKENAIEGERSSPSIATRSGAEKILQTARMMKEAKEKFEAHFDSAMGGEEPVLSTGFGHQFGPSFAGPQLKELRPSEVCEAYPFETNSVGEGMEGFLPASRCAVGRCSQYMSLKPREKTVTVGEIMKGDPPILKVEEKDPLVMMKLTLLGKIVDLMAKL